MVCLQLTQTFSHLSAVLIFFVLISWSKKADSVATNKRMPFMCHLPPKSTVVCLYLQVRLVINEKGLVCEERDVSLPLQEHKEPWFMRLNLGEEVPVFLHGDTIISDYNQIIDYLEKTFVGGMVQLCGSHLMMLILYLLFTLNF